MLKDITLGQYYPTESVIHRLDPRVKLVATLMYIVSLFLFHDFVGFIVVTLFLIAIIRMSHVPFSFMLKGVRAIWLLVVITAVCNLFFTQGAQTYSYYRYRCQQCGLFYDPSGVSGCGNLGNDADYHTE